MSLYHHYCLDYERAWTRKTEVCGGLGTWVFTDPSPQTSTDQFLVPDSFYHLFTSCCLPFMTNFFPTCFMAYILFSFVTFSTSITIQNYFSLFIFMPTYIFLLSIRTNISLCISYYLYHLYHVSHIIYKILTNHVI